MKSFAPSNEKKFGTVSQTKKHQITWPNGIRISPSLRGKATSFLTTRDGVFAEHSDLPIFSVTQKHLFAVTIFAMN